MRSHPTLRAATPDDVEAIATVWRRGWADGHLGALLRHGEQVIGARHSRAWLAVVAGNARARRFYARNGWRDAAPIDYPAEVASGTVTVPCRRYEKPVRS